MRDLHILCLIIFLSLGACRQPFPPPAPYGALPSSAQMDWQKMEYYMFVHFGPNTFTNKEWGDGTENPQLFNPTDLDCTQWVETAQKAGMKGIIITAKHHDGFCLWPSQYSTHTVRESPWKNGKGDVLKELSVACRQAGLKFGIYLSPWDRNHPSYGTKEYNQLFASTLTEVLTNYGDIFEVWFDGANGEGTNGKRQEYDWNLFNNTVYKHQPDAIIFSDVGPGCRWIGNEAGYAGETNWSRLDIEGFMPGKSPHLDTLNSGNRYGKFWVPGEVDVSIRPGWFYSQETDNQVKPVDKLVDIFCASVGRNANLLLNVPVDQSGRIHFKDSTRLMELKHTLDNMFTHNLAENKRVTADAVRGNDKTYAAENLLDGRYDSYWATDDHVFAASIEIDLGEKKDINSVLLQEYIPLGQRVSRFVVEAWDESKNTWKLLVEGTTIGYKRILRFETYRTNKIKLHIQEALASPVLNNIEIYHIPQAYLPATEKTESSLINNEGHLPTEKWTIQSPVHTRIVEIIDGKKTSVSINKNEAILIDLGEETQFRGFFYMPEEKVSAANLARYNFLISHDGVNWTMLKRNAMFDNIRNNPIRQNQFFDRVVKGRYVKLEPLELTNQAEKYIVVEFGLLK